MIIVYKRFRRIMVGEFVGPGVRGSVVVREIGRHYRGVDVVFPQSVLLAFKL